MNENKSNNSAERAKSLGANTEKQLHGPPVGESQGKTNHRRIDQPEQLSAPHQLPAFRDLQRLMNAIQDEEVDFTNFCEVLGDVPQVKNMILRDARSILSGRGNRIETVKHAVAMLGLRKIRFMLSQLAEPYEQVTPSEEDTGPEKIARVSA